jgi:potassium-dependent mechanosensitive channel
MKLGPTIRAVLAALALVLLGARAYSFDTTILIAAEQETAGLRSDLERVQSVIEQENVTDEQLVDQRGIVDKLRVEMLDQANTIAVPYDDIKQQLNQLGPAPASGQTETDAIATQRAALTDAVARYTAAKKQFELLSLEADQISGKISEKQRDQFFQRIFKADKSIFNPSLWRDTATGAVIFFSRLASLLSAWWTEQTPNIEWIGLAILPAVLLVIGSIYHIARLNFANWLPARPEENAYPSPLRRLWRVILGAFLTFCGLAVLAILIATSMAAANLSTPRFDLIENAFIGVFVPSIFNTALAYLICSPGQPAMRLIAVDERAAKTVPLFVFFASCVQAVATQVSNLSNELLLPVSLVAGQSAIAAAVLISLAGILLFVLRKQVATPVTEVPEPHYLTWFVSFMPLLWLLLTIAVVGLLFGYLALSYFIAGKILQTVLVVVLIVLTHHFVDAFADTLQNPASALGQKLRQLSSWSEKAIGRLSLTLRTLADLFLVIIGVPWLLALWSVTWVDYRSFLNLTIVGFRLGNITISPLNILGLFGILIFGVALTRFITRWLDKRILTQTHLNKGVQDSVRTGANYAGYVMAAAFALSAAGFDFSSVAIVAGALGVGIGFGLQSIVNNFVSGLILLAERPIRVGDWVVINDGEGIVKKINVRSTEIETFDNCTIIVPNSNLITGAVRNWTHQDTLGRFLVSVGVAHGSDVELVQAMLKTIVAEHPKVLRFPPPQVQLAKFSAATTDFEVRGHVADVFEAGQVASDLRFAISKQFNENGLVIPTAKEVKL